MVRLYHDNGPGTHLRSYLCHIACRYSHLLDLCYVRDLPGMPGVDMSDLFPMNWRFFPTLDPQVAPDWKTKRRVPHIPFFSRLTCFSAETWTA